jgi:hypothetical protein
VFSDIACGLQDTPYGPQRKLNCGDLQIPQIIDLCNNAAGTVKSTRSQSNLTTRSKGEKEVETMKALCFMLCVTGVRTPNAR